MKLPNHGMLYDPDTGKVLWIFVNGDPSQEHDLLPPLKHKRDGTVESGAQAHHRIIDWTDEFTSEEMQSLHRDHRHIRIKQEGGRLRVYKQIETGTPGLTTEILHQIEHQRQARAGQTTDIKKET